MNRSTLSPAPCLVVIQCRYASVRLPGKALYPLGGVPIVVFLIRRLVSQLPQEDFHIVLATTGNPEDDIVAVWGEHEKIDVIRGDSDDVLNRYMQCLQRFPSPYIARITADNPFTSPDILKQGMDLIRKQSLDYVQSEGNPYGAGVDIYSNRMIEHMYNHANQPLEREHINKYILDRCPESFQRKKYWVDTSIRYPEIRLTIDTLYDYQRITKLIDPHDHEPWNLSLHETLARMDRLPV